jgi:Flp pilus assembly protein TadB
MKKPGILQEQDGSFSMRRTLALAYTVCSIACLVVAAVNGLMAGVWAGAAALVGVLVLLGYTTLEEIKKAFLEAKGGACGKQD